MTDNDLITQAARQQLALGDRAEAFAKEQARYHAAQACYWDREAQEIASTNRAIRSGLRLAALIEPPVTLEMDITSEEQPCSSTA